MPISLVLGVLLAWIVLKAAHQNRPLSYAAVGVTFTAAPGEKNHVIVTSPDAATLLVRDTGVAALTELGADPEGATLGGIIALAEQLKEQLARVVFHRQRLLRGTERQGAAEGAREPL